MTSHKIGKKQTKKWKENAKTLKTTGSYKEITNLKNKKTSMSTSRHMWILWNKSIVWKNLKNQPPSKSPWLKEGKAIQSKKEK
jgi:hypothetical protein